MPAVDDVLLRDAERLASVERARRVMPRLPVPLDDVAGLAARLLDAPIGEVTLRAADEEYFAGVWGAPEPLAADRRQSVAYSVCKYAVSADHPVGSGDMWADPELRRHPLVTRFGIRSFVTVPLRDIRDRPIGSLSVLDTAARDWTGAHTFTLVKISELLAPVPVGEPRLRPPASELDSTSLLDSLLESFIAVDGEGAVVGWNRASEVMYGWSAEEALRKRLDDLIRPEYEGQHIADLLPQVLASPQVWREPHRMTVVHRSGRTMTAEVRLSVVPGASGPVVCGFAIDVTEQVVAEEAVSRYQRFLGALVDSLSDGVIACDAEGRVVLFNQAMRDLARVPDAGSPRYLSDLRERLFHPDGRAMAIDEIPLVRAVRGQSVHDVDVLVKTPDGYPRTFVVNGRPITTAAGQRLGGVAVIREVTDQRRNERLREGQLRMSQILASAGAVVGVAPDVLEVVADLGWDHVELWLVDDASATLRPVASRIGRDRPAAGSAPELADDGEVSDQVWATGRPLWIPDRADPSCSADAAGCRHRGLHTVLAVPVADAEDMYGVLACFAPAPQAPEDVLIGQLSSVADQLGRFLARDRATRTAVALSRTRHDFISLVG